MDRELLSSIRAFASTVSGSDTMKEVARDIVDHVGKIVCPIVLVCVNCRLTETAVSRRMSSHLPFPLCRLVVVDMIRDRHYLPIKSRLPISHSRLQ